jgi:hypothetical protein
MSIQRKLVQCLVAGAVLLAVGASAVGAGGPVGSGFLINAETDDQVFPAIAYNPERQEYLVVWNHDRPHPQDDDIYAQRVAWNGRLVGPRFAVTGPGAQCRYPDVVYNPTQKQYLVVWEEYDGTRFRIQGQRLTDTGQLVTPRIPISDPDSQGCYRPAVAYALVADRYLVVWNTSQTTGDGIEGQALSTTGALLGSNLVIAAGTEQLGYHYNPDVAYNRSRDEYLVVWQRESVSPYAAAIYGRRVEGSGTPMGTGGFPIYGQSDFDALPAVAAIPTELNQGRYLVVWEHRASFTGNGRIYAQRLKGDGSPDSTVLPLSAPSTSEDDGVAVTAGSEGGREFLVAWTHEWGGGTTLNNRARTVPLVGSALGAETDLGSGSMANAWVPPSAVAAGRLGDFLLAYEHLDSVGASSAIYGRLWGTWVHVPLVIRRR